MFTNCYPNTLDTTVFYTKNYNNTGNPDTFIITGCILLLLFLLFHFHSSDIYAMWGRDSMN